MSFQTVEEDPSKDDPSKGDPSKGDPSKGGPSKGDPSPTRLPAEEVTTPDGGNVFFHEHCTVDDVRMNMIVSELNTNTLIFLQVIQRQR